MGCNMAVARPKETPKSRSFFWHALLILVPVAALAVFGLISLRQDRVLAEREAQERAQALAESVARDCRLQLAADVSRFAAAAKAERDTWMRQALSPQAERGVTNGGGRTVSALALGTRKISLRDVPRVNCIVSGTNLIEPPDFPSVPGPPDWLLSVSPEWLSKWEAAEDVLNRKGDMKVARPLLEAVLEGGAEPLAANARFSLALAEEPSRKFEALLALSTQLTNATTECGVPLADLALLRAMPAAPAGQDAFGQLSDAIVSIVRHRPSFLTEKLVEALEERAKQEGPEARAAAGAVRALWETDNRARGLLTQWIERHRADESGFLAADEGRFLVFSSPEQTSSAVMGVSDSTNGAVSLKSADVRTYRLKAGDTAEKVAEMFGITVKALRAANSSLEPFHPTQVLNIPPPATTNVPVTDRFLVTLVPEEVVSASLRAVAAGPASDWPSYFGVGFEMAGRRMSLSPGPAGQDSAGRLLAERVDTSFICPFTVTVQLTNPALLYARQQQRLWLFGGLILAAGIVALLGAGLLWRNLERQTRLNQAKSNFVSSVSHELRAPIASVRLMAESLERGKVPEPARQQEYFRFIGQECRRLSSLIENVLDFSRIEQGRKQYEFEPTDLVALTRQTVRLMETYAAEQQIHLQLEAPDPSTNSCMQPLADGKALQQALVNLIDNAIKHSPKGGTVRVGLEVEGKEDRGQKSEDRGQKPGQHESRNREQATCVGHSAPRASHTAPHLSLWVEDDGEGVPVSEHEKIFERFYRRGSELRRETQGVGIGLSIVKHIVEAHRGSVRVRSEVGRGSRFTIELPLSQEKAT